MPRREDYPNIREPLVQYYRTKNLKPSQIGGKVCRDMSSLREQGFLTKETPQTAKLDELLHEKRPIEGIGYWSRRCKAV